jgi:hypothetical protein
MNTNVIEHQTAIWSRLQANCTQEQAHGDAARALWPQIAADMAALRNKYKADQEFGAALVEHGIEYNKNDRAAFVWMGTLKPEALRDAIANCESRSPQHFKTAVESWGDSYYAASVSSREETATDHADESVNTDETPSIPANSSPVTEPENVIDDDDVKLPQMNSRNILFKTMGQDIAEKIQSHWTHRITRQAFNILAKASGGKKAIKRIAHLIDEYSLEPNNNQYAANPQGTLVNSFSHRVFFPEIPAQWGKYHGCKWDNPRAIHAILNELDDANRMMEELGATASLQDCVAWWKTRDKQAASVTGVADLSAFSQPETKPALVTPSVNSETDQIIVHGQTIWPSDSGRYTFEEAWAAFHFWDDENRYVASLGATLEARSRHWMPMNKWLQYVSHGYANAWHRITTAQHQHPELEADTHAPGIHHKTV